MKNFLSDKLSDYGKKRATLNYIFCSDDELLAINQIHLNHDFYTDIITFDLSEEAEHLISDIYISVDRIKENAAKHQASLNLELRRVIFHGVLHLVGYQDKTVSEKRKMRKLEEMWLDEFRNNLNRL